MKPVRLEIAGHGIVLEPVQHDLAGDHVNVVLPQRDMAGAGAGEQLGPLARLQHADGLLRFPLVMLDLLGGLIDVEEHDGCVTGNEGVSLRDQREIFHGQGAL